jgi:hypothetical protein
VVDSNERWLSLDKDGLPVSMREIHSLAGQDTIQWQTPPIKSIYIAIHLSIFMVCMPDTATSFRRSM